MSAPYEYRMYQSKPNTTIITIGSTPETFYQELETEETEASTTREEFFEELDEELNEERSVCDFQAIYNYMTDQYVMDQYIARCTTNKFGTLKTNPAELKMMLEGWLNGMSVPELKNITKVRSLEYRQRYYVICRHHFGFFYNGRYNKYAKYSHWLKKRKTNV